MCSISYFLQLKNPAVFVVLLKKAAGFFREVLVASPLNLPNVNFWFLNLTEHVCAHLMSGSKVSAAEGIKISGSFIHSCTHLVIHSTSIFEHLLLTSY